MRLFLCTACALLLVLATRTLFAQNSEALKHARAGFDYEQKNEFRYAIYEYDTAAKLDPKYPYPIERIAGMYQTLKNYPLAITNYERAIRLDSNFDVYNYYNLGLSFRIVEKHDSAVVALREFLRRMDPVTHTDSMAMRDADWWIKFNLGCIVERAKVPNTEEPKPLNEINSAYDDFGPSITADGNTLYFTSTRPGTNTKQVIETGNYGEDLFVTHRDSLGRWGNPTSLPAPLNSLDDEGSASISADGQTMYISLCRRPDGAGDCDIYVSQLVGDQWTRPQNMGRPLNSPAWDAQPSVTADGLTMYFSSRRFGSMGDSSEDIYVCYKNTDGSWTPPHNLGEPVNTRFNERSPFISADGRTLYFSSNGHPGMGNHDLFMSRKLDDGTWSVPVNLGKPINSFGDDAFLTIPASGDKIVYASQRKNPKSPLHLYEAKLPLEFRPGPVTLVAGTVYDRETHKPVGARVDVNDLKTDQLVAVYHANKLTGKYYVTLGTGKMYGITATAEGYAPYSDHYTVPDTIPYREITHDLPLTPIPNFATSEGRDTTGDWARNHPSGTDTTGLWARTHPQGRDTTGLWAKTHRHGKDTTGLWARTHPHGKDTTGQWALRHPVKDTTGQWALNHPDTSGTEIHNIFFDFDKATLRPESHTELKYWIALLKKYPKLKIEIGGHTDSVGTTNYNHRLSQQRADAVRQYMIDNGIAARRLIAIGYGATKPKASNETPEGRQQNRRTEFRFIK